MGVRAQAAVPRRRAWHATCSRRKRPEPPLPLGRERAFRSAATAGPRRRAAGHTGAPQSIQRPNRRYRRVGELRGLLRHVRLFFVPDQRREPARLAASLEHAGHRPAARGPRGRGPPLWPCRRGSRGSAGSSAGRTFSLNRASPSCIRLRMVGRDSRLTRRP